MKLGAGNGGSRMVAPERETDGGPPATFSELLLILDAPKNDIRLPVLKIGILAGGLIAVTVRVFTQRCSRDGLGQAR